ncbi:MAG TPA: LamG-like jellyroll fold domain-containing protein [Capsulimonadaceae bacterium]
MRARILLRTLLAACAFTAVTSANAQWSPPAAPGPAQNGVPVIFWAHYMPQIPLCHMHNGTDALPLVTQDGTALDQNMRTIEVALDSGINGFQMLCGAPEEFYTAAHRVRERTGKTMYIAPEWCDQEADPVKGANAIADFAIKHDSDPCIAKAGGAQIHFFYGTVKWAIGDGLAKARQIFKDRGVKILLVPTIYDFPQQVLNSEGTAAHKPFPAFGQPPLGNSAWLENLGWDGATGFGQAWRSDVALALNDKLKERTGSFTFFPDIWPSYDCSNRENYSIHCRIPGLAPVRDGLRIWTGLGYKQFSFITWNDMNETLLMPSNRNVYGYSAIINYYHRIAECGQSPFDSPKFVVAYEPEALVGDQTYFQCAVLPEHNTVASDYVISYRIDDQYGRTLTTIGARAALGRETDDQLVETRLDTTPFAGKTEVLVPYVTVRQYDIGTGETRTLYSNMRLAPVRLRYNNVRFNRPLVIALDRIAPEVNIALDVKRVSGPSAVATASVTGSSSLKRLVLAESLLSAGSFREDDTASGIPTDQVRQYVRIELNAKTRCRLTIDGGTINERYTPYWTMSLCRSVGPATTMDYDSQQQWGAPWNVFRLTGKPGATITLTIDPKGTAQSITTTLGAISARNVRKTVDIAGQPVTVTFLSTTGTTEANIDYPLPATGSYQRALPLSEYGEAIRVYHAYALTDDGKIAYSNPVVMNAKDYAAKPIKLAVVETHGTFDDFVNDAAEESRNPYSASDVSIATLSAGDVPYYRLGFDEGMGNLLNDAGLGHQFGAARVDGTYEWLARGWRGAALKLGPDAAVKIRSTSWPYGQVTVSLRVSVAPDAATNAASILSFGPFKVSVGGGKIAVSQRFTKLTAEGTATLTQGWNHIALVYDLSRLYVYVNGTLAATSTTGTPILQRTHWAPELRITSSANKPPALDGGIDQVEVIGTSLAEANVKLLYQRGSWQ